MIESIADPQLMERAERMLVESVLDWTQWQHIDAIEQDDAILTKSPIDFPLFNNVLSPRLPSADLESRVEAINSLLSEQTRGVCWWLGARSTPSNLADTLQKAGAFCAMESTMMARNLDGLADIDWPQGMQIDEVTSASQLSQWSDLVTQVHQVPPVVADNWQDMYQAAGYGKPDSVHRHFIARMGEQVVGAASLITAAGVASLSNVSTDPNHSNKGIGKALTLHALKQAQLAGYRVACLSASDEGKRIYQKLGFEEFEQTQAFIWLPRQL
ncbi:hypothetical protein GCM10007895_16180 [Paraferrimonas sedimenticola]|uniref:N-acetyltransferase domain-containing protein n=2 Tax=Paraferrimonas sedimenticola TaxID=375674 RepID=A0AA37W1J8_9GAMM|nr:hypothetical protein GCM10007895_16180 [Paraferrimonas sedimenticola]